MAGDAFAEGRQSDFNPLLLPNPPIVWRDHLGRDGASPGLAADTHASSPLPTQMTRLTRATVKSSEYGLYALLLLQPATGLLTTLFGGRPFPLFLWQILPIHARDEMLRAAFHLPTISVHGACSLDRGPYAAALFTISC